jgi:ADP-ribosyl-[dinitrogen reductase] hydrolase
VPKNQRIMSIFQKVMEKRMEQIWRHNIGANDIKNRAVGSLLGLAVGDALGTTLEFTSRDTCPAITDIVGGGPFHLKAGQFTDDSSMALALADSLLHDSNLEEYDFAQRLCRWWRTGEYSCTGDCFDIGNATRQALEHFEETGNPIAGSTDPRSAGNGSAIRLAPAAIRHWSNPHLLADVAARQSRVTHAAPEAVDACVAFGAILGEAVGGMSREDVLRARYGYNAGVGRVMAGSWRGKHRDQIKSTGYVVDGIEAAMWSIASTDSFEGAVLLAVNLGVDSDSVGAMAGQFAGAIYGASAIPAHWLAKLSWADRIEQVAVQLFDGSVAA